MPEVTTFMISDRIRKTGEVMQLIDPISSLHVPSIPTTARLNNMKKLRAIEDLQDNWNGYGAKAFSPSVIRKVREILNELWYQPEIFPVANDTIQMEFRNADHDYLELDIDATDRVSVLIERCDGTQKEFNTFDDMTSINAVVQGFYE